MLILLFKKLFFDYRHDFSTSTGLQTKLQNCLKENSQFLESPKQFLHKLRVKKSPGEIKLLKKACEIASQAIKDTMAVTKPDIGEQQLFAKVDYGCRLQGANYLSYPPVVASGERATIIHYIDNNQIARDGDMILMDAGCEYYGYTSDITRTWPVNGKFTKEQKILYEIVLAVQESLIDMCEAFPSLESLFDAMCLLLGRHLQGAGLISKMLTGHQLMKVHFFNEFT